MIITQGFLGNLIITQGYGSGTAPPPGAAIQADPRAGILLQTGVAPINAAPREGIQIQ